ncbi:MAG: hypothetical protein QN183_13770 [Armatimonadota bacterium]|nr:hypothetical protein [Armatimonadota bacterium]
MPDWTVRQPVLAADLNTIMPSGSTTVFDQDAAPAGWTRNTTVADRLVRIVSGAGGGTGGSWTITGLSASHTHGVPTVTVNTGAQTAFTATAAPSQGVTSDGTWRPRYHDVILCQRTDPDWTSSDVLTTAALNRVIPSTSRMIWDQDVAPAGWTRDTARDDILVRIVSGARGADAGSWTITGLSYAHSHGITGPANTTDQTALPYQVVIVSSPTASASPAVSSNGTWRPAYRDAIVCARTEPDAAGAILRARHLNTIAPAGSRTVFVQAAAPAGWVQDTSVADRMVRLVAGSRGPQGGSWTISGLSVASHAHGVTTGNRMSDAPANPRGQSISAATATVTGDGTWRPPVIDAIVAARA